MTTSASSNDNNDPDNDSNGYYVKYNPVFRRLLEDALGFDAMNPGAYDVRIRKVSVSSNFEGMSEATSDRQAQAHTVTTFHVEHLNVVARMGLFENSFGVDSNGQGQSSDVGERYRRFVETLYAVPAFARPVGTARLDFGNGRHVAFVVVWDNGAFMEGDTAITVGNAVSEKPTVIDSTIMSSLYALHRTSVTDNAVLTNNTLPIADVLRERADALSEDAVQSLKVRMDETLRDVILAGREESSSTSNGDEAEVLLNRDNEEEEVKRVRADFEFVENARQRILALIDDVESSVDSDSLLSSDTVLLYDNLDDAFFGRKHGCIANIGLDVYRGPAIVDLGYIYHLVGNDESAMRLALSDYGVRSRAISQEMNGEVLERVQEFAEVFGLLGELKKFV